MYGESESPVGKKRTSSARAFQESFPRRLPVTWGVKGVTGLQVQEEDTSVHGMVPDKAGQV